MVNDEDYTIELMGTDSSQQNSIAEQPHRDLAQMMQCLLYSSDLGSEYWLFALAHVVYIKKRLFHSSLGTLHFKHSLDNALTCLNYEFLAAESMPINQETDRRSLIIIPPKGYFLLIPQLTIMSTTSTMRQGK